MCRGLEKGMRTGGLMTGVSKISIENIIVLCLTRIIILRSSSINYSVINYY